MSKEAAAFSGLAALALAFVLATAAPAPAFGQTPGVESGEARSASPSDKAPEARSAYFRFAAGASAVPSGNVAASLSAAVGKHAIFSTIRGEVEASMSSDVWSPLCRDECPGEEVVDLGTLALLVSAYYDFRKGRAWTPFIGVGVRYEGRTTTEDHRPLALSGTGFGYHSTAGVAYAPGERLTVQMGYRALAGLGRREHQLHLGLRLDR